MWNIEKSRFCHGRKSEHVYPRMSFPFVTCSKRMTNMSKKWCSSVVSHLWGPRRMKLSVFFLTPKLCHGRNAGWRKKWSPKVRSKSCELFHLLKWTSAKFARITSKVWSFGAPLPCVKLFFYHHFNLWGLSIVTEGIVTEGNLSAIFDNMI